MIEERNTDPSSYEARMRAAIADHPDDCEKIAEWCMGLTGRAIFDFDAMICDLTNHYDVANDDYGICKVLIQLAKDADAAVAQERFFEELA